MPPVLEHGIIEELSARKKEIIREGNEILKYLYTRIHMRKRPKSFEEILREYKTLTLAEGQIEIMLKGVPADGRSRQENVIRTSRKEYKNLFKRLSALFHLYKALEMTKVA